MKILKTGIKYLTLLVILVSIINGFGLFNTQAAALTDKTNVLGLVQVFGSGTTPKTTTTPPNQLPTCNTTTSNPCDVAASCSISGDPFSWIMCPIINSISKAIDGFYHYIVTPMLNLDTTQYTSPSNNFYKAWSNFRLLADMVLVGIFLIVLFGETIGGGMLDAYTIKKVIPRLVVMIIVSNLSLYIVVGLIDVFNIFGKGIAELMVAPFPSLSVNGSWSLAGGIGFAGLMSVFFGSVGVATIIAIIDPVVFLGAIFLILVAAMIGLAATIITLAIRDVLIIFLLIVSPVAFILYVLPNTEKIFKKWWSLLIKTLMVYPIVFVMFALSQIAAVIFMSGVTGSGILSVVDIFLAIISMVFPLFIIPFAFKFSGGVVGSAYNLVGKGLKNNMYRSTMKAARKGLINRGITKDLPKVRSGNAININPDKPKTTYSRTADKLNDILQTASMLPSAGANPKKWGDYIDAAKEKQAISSTSDAVKRFPGLSLIAGSGDALDAGLKHGTDYDKIYQYLKEKTLKGEKRELTDSERRNVGSMARFTSQSVKDMGYNTYKKVVNEQLKPAMSSYLSDDNEAVLKTYWNVLDGSGGSVQEAISSGITASKVASQAGRSDLSLSPGVIAKNMPLLAEHYAKNKDLAEIPSEDKARILSEFTQNVRENMTPSSWASAKPTAIANMARYALDAIPEVANTGGVEEKKLLAFIAQARDMVNQTSIAQNEKMADLYKFTDKKTGEVYDALAQIKKFENDPEFQEFRTQFMPMMGGQGGGNPFSARSGPSNGPTVSEDPDEAK